ncbi:MAG: hypothetical protein QM676_03855 [Novosphingobium sp.]
MANQVPQLIFPADLEKLLIARGIVEHRFGISAGAHVAGMDLRRAVSAASALEVPRFNLDRMATLSPEASLDVLLSGRRGVAG